MDFFPPNKIPDGWVWGKKAGVPGGRIIKTGLKKGDPELNKLIASRTKERTARGAAHTETKVWTLSGPDDTIHTVVGLHEFCREHGLSATSIQYSINTNKPIKKGKSKGWRLLSKK